MSGSSGVENIVGVGVGVGVGVRVGVGLGVGVGVTVGFGDGVGGVSTGALVGIESPGPVGAAAAGEGVARATSSGFGLR